MVRVWIDVYFFAFGDPLYLCPKSVFGPISGLSGLLHWSVLSVFAPAPPCLGYSHFVVLVFKFYFLKVNFGYLRSFPFPYGFWYLHVSLLKKIFFKSPELLFGIIILNLHQLGEHQYFNSISLMAH